jgi:hypothetical protein
MYRNKQGKKSKYKLQLPTATANCRARVDCILVGILYEYAPANSYNAGLDIYIVIFLP